MKTISNPISLHRKIFMLTKPRPGIFLVIFLLASSSLAYGSAHCAEFSNDWAKCDLDDDCVLDESACYSVAAYHKQYLEAVREYNKCMRPMIKCAPPPEGDKLKTLAVCREKQCMAIVPVSKKND